MHREPPAAAVAQPGLFCIEQRDQESQDALTAVRINNQGAEFEKAGNFREALEKHRAAAPTRSLVWAISSATQTFMAWNPLAAYVIIPRWSAKW